MFNPSKPSDFVILEKNQLVQTVQDWWYISHDAILWRSACRSQKFDKLCTTRVSELRYLGNSQDACFSTWAPDRYFKSLFLLHSVFVPVDCLETFSFNLSTIICLVRHLGEQNARKSLHYITTFSPIIQNRNGVNKMLIIFLTELQLEDMN